MERKISAIIISLLILTSIVVIVNNELYVEATGGEGEGDIDNIGLDYNFLWNVSDNVSQAVYKAWEGDEITKGREFGSKGDIWTADLIRDYMTHDCGLENVDQIPLGPIAGCDDRFYTSKINVSDYLLHIDNPDYNSDTGLPNDVPKNETFVFPQAYPKWGSLTFNSIMEDEDNVQVIEPLTINWPTAGTLTNYYLNLSVTAANQYNLIMGNATYVADDDPLPEDQDDKVLIFDEEEGVCEERLENVTNASSVILIHNVTSRYNTTNASNCSFSVGRVNSNENNLSEILYMLNNSEIIIVENILYNETLTFTYNINSENIIWLWDDFILIDELKLPNWGFNYDIWFPVTYILRLINTVTSLPFLGECRGVILFNNFTYGSTYNGTHFMNVNNPALRYNGWFRFYYTDFGVFGFPGLPIYWVNYTVGHWLIEHAGLSNNTVTGYVNQNYLKEEHWPPGNPSQWTSGVTAYNVIGNITTDRSSNVPDPDDPIIIISNRYDGWWSEASFDSGCGVGVVLAIAKYFNDYNITPKVNITFLETTGEEYKFRGAQHFSDSHPDNNYSMWIGFDQLASNWTGSELNLTFNDYEVRNITNAIGEEMGYPKRTNNDYSLNTSVTFGGSAAEEDVWKQRNLTIDEGGINCSYPCNTICFTKSLFGTYGKNPFRHRRGEDFTEGDLLKNIDREDLNDTLELAWNITKYFCVNPDCWFTNVTYQVFDSPNDSDALNDSIMANFTLNTIMPNDKLRVELLYYTEEEGSDILYSYQNYSVNSSGLNASVVFSIPDYADKGYYSIKLLLYNSTGIINKIVFNDKDYNNDTSDESNVFTLYHPFGYTEIGGSYKCVADNISGSIFTINENGYADNITAYINRAYGPPGPYKCMLYRLNDSKLIATTSEDWTPRDYEDPVPSMGWAVFNFSEPKPELINDTEYVITCWGENQYSRLYYDDFSYTRGRYDDNEIYGDPPNYANFSNESRLYSIYCSYTPDNRGPEITSITSNPIVVGYGFNVTIQADVYDISGVDVVKVNITKPKDTVETQGYDMTHISGDTYEYVFNNTWQNGQYNYSIYAFDANGNSNTSASFSFNVSVNASIKVCTVKDVYNLEEFVNITDPPVNHQLIGYEFLDDGKVLHVWNSFDSYYFNTSNGMQFTNHYNNYWSHNVLMLGYYNNEEWNLVYRVDELSGFNKNIVSDNESFVNVTLWEDLSYGGYDFRLAIRYFLGVDDNELTVIPYIKNLGVEIPYVLGFAWELKDIQVDLTPGGDYIEINGTSYYLNQSLDETYNNLTESCFYIREDFMGNKSESLYLRWDENLDYKVQVKSRTGQYNAPIILCVKIGTLGVGQEKYTFLFWHDASEVVYYFKSYDNGFPGESWLTNPGYMVDGNISTFASTSVDGDVELLDGNSCKGNDLGVIGKVELRCRGYSSGSEGPVRIIILRPVYSGGDGDDHFFVTNSSASWSVWFNITDDTNASGKWDWNNIIDLCCDVESNLSSGTLYCSKVEIRVTYNPYSSPEFSNPYPADGSMGVPITPLLNITVNHPLGSIMNISWYSNSSGSWQVFGVNNSVYNGTYYQLFSNASVNGVWWYWMVNASNGDVYNESSVFMFYTGNQSKIVNTGVTNFSGYLLMQVDYLEGEDWVLDTEVVDETSTRTILVGGQLGLDTVFNGKVITNDLSHGSGTYRVYAAFRDPYGDVLVCDDDSLLEAWYEFTVTFE
jgi:hypothetical protein